MKNLKWMAILTVFIALGFVFVSCNDPDDPPRDTLFESQTSDWSITVSNGSNKDLVAFAGSLTMQTRIGGVYAKTSNHNFPKDKSIFPDNAKSFQMLFITREDYEGAKDSNSALSALNNRVYVRTWVYWNGTQGDNTKVYRISENLGGNFVVQIFGPGNYDVEFREGGVAGPTLGYAPQNMMKTNLNVGPGNYDIFPIFQRHNTRRDVMETIIPIKPAEGNLPEGPFYYGFSFGDTTPANERTIMLNLSDASGSLSKMQTGVVYIYINNALTGSGQGIRAYRGSVPLTTASGQEIINNGTSENRIFAIMLPEAPGGGYAESITASFSVMLGTTQVSVKSVDKYNPVTGQTGTADVTTYPLLADMMYTINVVGPGLIPTIELRKGQTSGPVTFAPESNGTQGDTGIPSGLNPPS